MNALLPSKRKARSKKMENVLYRLVDKKEKREQAIDDEGRALIITLQEYRENRSRVKYRALMRESNKYIKANSRYY